MIHPISFAAVLTAAALAFAGPASAQSDLAAELKQLAQSQQGTASTALASVSYNDAIYLMDELNHADYRRLSQAMTDGRLDLPTAIRQALELKAPRLNQRGAGR